MWRYGFNTPKDYQDNEGFCGGFQRQWGQNGGKCGLCGNPWDSAVKEHEAPGKYATGTIVRSYGVGQSIPVTVDVTANHRGRFVFSVCPAPSSVEDPTQECLDASVLSTSSGLASFPLPSTSTGKFSLEVLLPPGLQCDHCLLQWTYIAGNNWGICANGTGAIGCGNQEHFRACADIRIGPGGGNSNPPATIPGVTTPAPAASTGTPPETTGAPGSSGICFPVGAYAANPAMVTWCNHHCFHCPKGTDYLPMEYRKQGHQPAPPV